MDLEKMETGKFLSLLIVILVIFAGLLMFVAGFFYPLGFDALGIDPVSTYTYTATVDATGELTGVTMFLPVPSNKGNSPLGVEFADGRGTGLGSGITADYFAAKDAAFIKVVGDRLRSEKLGAEVEIDPMIIDTKNPVANAYLFAPAEADSDPANYKVNVYLKYNCAEDTVVKISLKCVGKNQWSYYNGDKDNSYVNTMELSVKGPQSGWVTADASCVSGMGDYRISL
jgi:hypothetical protein